MSWENAMRVFGYLVKHLLPNKDRFTLYMDQCLLTTGYRHKKDVYVGIVGLIGLGIIARSKYPGEYFINPLICFNGSRVTFAKQYVKKKKEVDRNQLPLPPGQQPPRPCF